MDYTDSVSALPPINGTLTAIGKKDSSSDLSTRDQISQARIRGMSFELFAFTHNDSLPSDFVDLKEVALNGGRPRGDSIIFDPVSFSDGGIHEENALQRLRRNSIALEETDELELMNTPGFNEGSNTK